MHEFLYLAAPLSPVPTPAESLILCGRHPNSRDNRSRRTRAKIKPAA